MPIPKKYQFKTEEPYGWLSPGLRESLDLVINGGQLPQVTISPTKGEMKASKQRAAEAKQRAAEKEAFMGNTKKPNLVQSAGKAIKNLPRNAEEIAENTMANLGVLSPANWIATGASAVDAGLGLIPGYQRDYDRIYLPTDKYNPRLSGISRVGGLFKGNPTVDEVAGLVTDFAMPGVFEYAMASAPRVARGLNALERGASKIGRRTAKPTQVPSQEFVTTATEALPDFTYSYSNLPEDLVRRRTISRSKVADKIKSIKKKALKELDMRTFVMPKPVLLQDGATGYDYINAVDKHGRPLYRRLKALYDRIPEYAARYGYESPNVYQDVLNKAPVEFEYSPDYYGDASATLSVFSPLIEIGKQRFWHMFDRNYIDKLLTHEFGHLIQGVENNFSFTHTYNPKKNTRYEFDNGTLKYIIHPKYKPKGPKSSSAPIIDPYATFPELTKDRAKHATGAYNSAVGTTEEVLTETSGLKSEFGWTQNNWPSTEEFIKQTYKHPEIANDIIPYFNHPEVVPDKDAFVQYLLKASAMLTLPTFYKNFLKENKNER